MKLLLVASDPAEFRGLFLHCRQMRKPGVQAHWSRAGLLGPHEVLLVANGAGPKRAAAAVDSALASFHPDAIVSMGFCGALDPSLAIAVEMEAAGVAQRAQTLGLPFFCVKAVTDLAGETMANDFNAVLRSDGRFDTIGILASSLRHPWVRLPELFRLRSRSLLAARSLGEFIADCRF